DGESLTVARHMAIRILGRSADADDRHLIRPHGHADVTPQFLAHREHEATQLLSCADRVADNVTLLEAGSSSDLEGERLDRLAVIGITVKPRDGIGQTPEPSGRDDLGSKGDVSELLINLSLR